MADITYGAGGVAAPDVATGKIGKIGKNRKGFFARMLDAIAYSQIKRAEREFSRYRDLLPPDFVLRRSLRTGEEKKPPFGGR
jgi:hypothetical protein